MDLPGILGIGNCQTQTMIESIQVLEVTGKGRIRTSPAAGKPANPDPLQLGLVAHWRLNDGSGATAADSSGNKLTGKLMGGAQWIKGKSGGLHLDGVTGCIEIPSAPILDRHAPHAPGDRAQVTPCPEPSTAYTQ